MSTSGCKGARDEVAARGRRRADRSAFRAQNREADRALHGANSRSGQQPSLEAEAWREVPLEEAE